MILLKCRVVLSQQTFFGLPTWKRWSHNSSGLSYLHHIGKEPLSYKTIGDLVDSAADKHSDRFALIACEEQKKFTFRDIKEQTDLFAAGLLECGFKKGDRLALWGSSTSDWYISFLGAAKIGVISVLLNPEFQLKEVEYSLNKVTAKGIMFPEFFKKQNNWEIIKMLSPKFDISGEVPKCMDLDTIIISSEKKFKNSRQWTEILESGRKIDRSLLEKEKSSVNPSDPLCFQFTSGTTGKPKVASLSHYNFYNNSYHIARRHQLFEKHHTFLIQSPFFHAFATDIVMCPALHSGTTLVVPSKTYNPVKSLVAIEAEQCTFVNGTPTMFVDLVDVQKKRNFNVSSLELSVTGGAPCPPTLLKNLFSILGLKAVKSVYGLTETSGVIFQSLPNDDKFQSTETVGFLQDHLEARVVDENGKLVPFGQPGELHIKGYCNMLEYYNDPAKTKQTINGDQWLKTGDQFVLYENGYGKVVGRLKDMIIRGGENIFPKEVEDFLNTHPKVLDNQIFGVPDERLGEELFCCIRLRNQDDPISHAELIKYCDGKLAKFKIPKFIDIVQDFPRTASGKIQKFKLQQIYNNTKRNEIIKNTA